MNFTKYKLKPCIGFDDNCFRKDVFQKKGREKWQ